MCIYDQYALVFLHFCCTIAVCCVQCAVCNVSHDLLAMCSWCRCLANYASLHVVLSDHALMRARLFADVDVVTLGQYMRPTKRHMAVAEYVTPEAFARYQAAAEGLGFAYAASGPLVRSSYKAGEFFLRNMLRGREAEELKAATA